MHRTVLVSLMALALGACATTPNSTVTPMQALQAVTVGVRAAEIAASLYAGLPACGSPGSGALCSRPDIVVQMNLARGLVDAALSDAQMLIADAKASPAAQSAAIDKVIDATSDLTKVTPSAPS